MKTKRIISCVLAALMIAALVPMNLLFAENERLSDRTVITKKTKYAVAKDVKEYELTTNSNEFDRQNRGYVMEVKPGENVELRVGYNDYDIQNLVDHQEWRLEKPTIQAANAENRIPGMNIVGVTNADGFNMATGRPASTTYMRKRCVYEGSASSGCFWIDDETGAAHIADTSTQMDEEANSKGLTIRECFGCFAVIVRDGKKTDLAIYDNALGPRTVYGIKPDGTVVIYVVEGRLEPNSYGMDYGELADVMLYLGCEIAVNVDGGGSSVFATQREGEPNDNGPAGLTVRSHPSDGVERQVATSLFVVSTAKQSATSSFDHAALYPNNELYTPGSEVQFSAVGADEDGFPAELPQEGLSWKLAPGCESLGAIDNNGLFTAGDTEGVVTVNLIYEGETVGETAIEIAEPDQVYFPADEVSLDFDEVTDFKLTVRNTGRDVHFKEGDLVWSKETPEGKPDIGVFEGNKFRASSENSSDGTVFVKSKFDETVGDSIHVIVGQLPQVAWDFEDYEAEDGTVTSASDYYVGENGILTLSTYGCGTKGSMEIIKRADGEPVRFGEHALKLNFDNTDVSETDGVCIGLKETITIPGTPKAIGMWVYVPEGVGVLDYGTLTDEDGKLISGLWLRGYVGDGHHPFDFTLEPKAVKLNEETGEWEPEQPGLHWTGWKYCEADLSKYAPPYNLLAGMTIRLMYVPGIGMIGTQKTGCIYCDNLQFVYGSNIDDIDRPIIKSIDLNGTELSDGAELNSNMLDKITVSFDDVQNKYTSGIDMNTVHVFVDGMNVAEDKTHYQYGLDEGAKCCYLYNLELTNGEHTLTVSLCDNFGNETVQTRSFTVNGEEAADKTSISVVPDAEGATLGGVVQLQITASNNDVAECAVMIQVNNLFKNFDVEFAPGYTGDYKVSELTHVLTVNAQREAKAQHTAKAQRTGNTGNLIATVKIPVPINIQDDDNLIYTVKGGSFTTDDGYYATYYQPAAALPVIAAYTINAAPVLEGESATLIVYSADNYPAGAISVYDSEGDVWIGATDSRGKLTTDYFSEVGDKTIYAKDEYGLSFLKTIRTFAPCGEQHENGSAIPYNILYNTTADPATKKDISWFSYPKTDVKQRIKYGEHGSEEALWKEETASSTLRTFTADECNKAVNVNNITLENLKPNTEYDYRIGCDEVWSETRTFKTFDDSQRDAEFFILGDVQAKDTTNINSIMGILKEGNYDFGIQTGDAVDRPASYNQWAEMTGIFGTDSIGAPDLIHVLGNHEYQGDATGAAAATIYHLPEEGVATYYSVEYGCVYIAVINYTSTRNELIRALDWLKTDAAESKATWKILSMHQPAYYTNALGGNAEIYDLVPDAVEEAGINVVFAGHDHSCARTNRLRDGKIDEEEGILYYICGTSGEKAYEISSGSIFDYDTIFKYASIDFAAIYLTASADLDNLTINVYDLGTEEFDTVTLRSKCARKGHVQQYDPVTGNVYCTVCGRVITDPENGVINDADGNEYYLVDGKLIKGWKNMNDEHRYYNEQTGVRENVTEDRSHATACTKRGYIVLTASPSGATMSYADAYPSGHDWDENHICRKCGKHGVDINDEKQVTIGFGTVENPLKHKDGTPYTKDETPVFLFKNTPHGLAPHSFLTVDGKTELTQSPGDVLNDDGTMKDIFINWANHKAVGLATIRLQGRGDYYGEVELHYKLIPRNVKDLRILGHDESSVTLTWSAVDGVDTYHVYECDSKNSSKSRELIADVSGTAYTIKGLKPNEAHYYVVLPFKIVKETEYSAVKYSNILKAAAGTLGDYNCDGIVDIQDALLTLRAAMGLITPSEQSIYNADVNFDGKLTIEDAILILRAEMNLIELTLPEE